jgi:hypothetical protein
MPFLHIATARTWERRTMTATSEDLDAARVFYNRLSSVYDTLAARVERIEIWGLPVAACLAP